MILRAARATKTSTVTKVLGESTAKILHKYVPERVLGIDTAPPVAPFSKSSRSISSSSSSSSSLFFAESRNVHIPPTTTENNSINRTITNVVQSTPLSFVKRAFRAPSPPSPPPPRATRKPMHSQGLYPDTYDETLKIPSEILAQQQSPDVSQCQQPMLQLRCLHAITEARKKKEWREAVRHFNDLRKEVVPHISVYNELLLVLRFQYKSGLAFAIYDEMIASGVVPNYLTFRHLLPQCAGPNFNFSTFGSSFNNNPAKARFLYGEMKKYGIKLDKYLYNHLLIGLSKTEGSIFLHQQMKREGVPLIPAAARFIIKDYCRFKRSDAFELYEEMIRAGVSPGLLPLTELLNLCGKLRAYPSTSQQIFMQLRAKYVDNNTTPPVYVYSGYIHSCATLSHIGHMEQALRMLCTDVYLIPGASDPQATTINELIQQVQDIDTLSFLMKGYLNVESYKHCNNIIDRIREIAAATNTKLTSSTYSLFLAVYAKQMNTDAIQQTLDEMEQQGITFSRTVFRIMLDLHGKLGNAEKTFDVFKLMMQHQKQRGWPNLDVFEFSIALRACKLIASPEKRYNRMMHYLDYLEKHPLKNAKQLWPLCRELFDSMQVPQAAAGDDVAAREQHEQRHQAMEQAFVRAEQAWTRLFDELIQSKVQLYHTTPDIVLEHYAAIQKSSSNNHYDDDYGEHHVV
eukprot:GEZU01022378.1.p1 GENE.GEZU01022378.1~~GEZU01022378.1.p1  ORF type:complete len:694 (-),score=158.11 GEZU01022378.1:55-2109(-)